VSLRGWRPHMLRTNCKVQREFDGVTTRPPSLWMWRSSGISSSPLFRVIIFHQALWQLSMLNSWSWPKVPRVWTSICRLLITLPDMLLSSWILMWRR
jgi:hypothetical protein